MTISRRRFISISAGMALAVKAGTVTAAERPVVWRGVVLGADAQLVIAGLPKQDARRIVDLALVEANRLEDIFSLYRGHSALAQLNRDGCLSAPPAEMLSLCSTADAVYKATGGLFDPSIQPLWQAYAENGGHVSPKQLTTARHLVGWDRVGFTSDQVAFERPGMALSFNGIAQGYITDRITDLLKAEGLRDALVKMGEIRAIGSDENGKPWKISQANYGENENNRKVRLRERAIATSAASGTTFDGAVSHILDPRSGNPSESRWQQVSVTHPSATIADGLSTAAVLMEEPELLFLAERFKSAGIIATDIDGGVISHNI